jgi:hypothetical protein
MRSFTERWILKVRSLSKSTPMRPVRGIEPRAGSAVGTKNALIIVVSQDGAVRYVDSLNGKVTYCELGPFKPRAVQPVFLRNTDRHPVPRRSDLLNYSQFRFGARRLWLLVAATPRWEKCRLQAPKGSCYLRFGLTLQPKQNNFGPETISYRHFCASGHSTQFKKLFISCLQLQNRTRHPNIIAGTKLLSCF